MRYTKVSLRRGFALDDSYNETHSERMQTNTEQRVARFADTMGKAIAKLARTDLEAARRMSDLAQTVAADMRGGKL